jgi:hypothetical protein
MKSYAVLLLVPAAMVAAWYGGGQIQTIAPPEFAEVPKYGLAELPSVSTDRVRRSPSSFATTAFGVKREPVQVQVAAAAATVSAAPRLNKASVLQAVMIDGNRRIAHIDGNVMREGALLGRQRIAHIEAKRVQLVSLDSRQVSWLLLDEVN